MKREMTVGWLRLGWPIVRGGNGWNWVRLSFSTFSPFSSFFILFILFTNFIFFILFISFCCQGGGKKMWDLMSDRRCLCLCYCLCLCSCLCDFSFVSDCGKCGKFFLCCQEEGKKMWDLMSKVSDRSASLHSQKKRHKVINTYFQTRSSIFISKQGHQYLFPYKFINIYFQNRSSIFISKQGHQYWFPNKVINIFSIQEQYVRTWIHEWW